MEINWSWGLGRNSRGEMRYVWWHILVAVVLYVTAMASIAAITAIVKKKRGEKIEFETRDLTYGAVCLGLAVALSLVRITFLGQGGSITLFSIVPIVIYAYYFGFVKALPIVISFTLLSLIRNPFIIHPWSFILDYLIPYSALAFTGVFAYSKKRYNKILEHNKNTSKFSKKKPIALAHWPVFVSLVLYFAVRFTSHVLSGVLFFYEWAPAGQSALTYSLIYNASYTVPDTLIALIGLIALLSSKTFNTFMASRRNALQNADTAHEHNQTA